MPVLLRGSPTAAPDVVGLQELKAADENFPEAAIRAAGYSAVWHGQKSWNGAAILARGDDPIETRRGLPGDPDDTHSRYIEAAVGRAGRLPLPPQWQPGPRPEIRLQAPLIRTRGGARGGPMALRAPQVVLAGDYNVMPTELDVYKPYVDGHGKQSRFWLRPAPCGASQANRRLAPGD